MSGVAARCFARRAALARGLVALSSFILVALVGARIAVGGTIERAHFAVIGTIPAKAGLWDYAAVDPESRRLYLADAGVLALDLATRQVIPRLVPGNLTHGIVPLGHGIVAVADGSHRQVVLFEGKTGRILERISTGNPPSADDWHNPDAMLVEPKTGELIAVNGDSGILVLIDLRRNAVASVIRVGGKLEFAAAGNGGIVYVNVESRNQLAVVDVPERRVSRRIPLPGCEEPTGLAYDPEFNLIISACSNGMAEFLRAETGDLAAQLHIGKGCDAVVLDAPRGLVYFPAGDSGSLSIVALRDRGKIHIGQRLRTAPGVRLGAVDPATGILYLPSVKYDLAAPRIRLPGLPALPAPLSGSFRFLMVARQPVIRTLAGR